MMHNEDRSVATSGPILMATALTMQHQLAELRSQIDFDDPVHAEAAFTAMVARIVHEAEVADSIAKLRDDRNRQDELARERAKGVQVMAEQLTDPIAERMMFGTAEAYDALEQHAERHQHTQDTRRSA